MPSFLLKKENKVVVLAFFFLVVIVIIPMIFICWNLNSSKYEEGVLIDNKRQYYMKLNENLLFKNIPEILSDSLEFYNMKAV